MSLLAPDSLAATVDAVQEASFFHTPMSETDRLAAAHWIAERQGMPGAYRGLFAPLPLDRHDGVRVFTGETRRSGAATAHILGEEACRALALLQVTDYEVQRALCRATSAVVGYGPDPRHGCGFYCCGACTVALWRNLLVAPLPSAHERIACGVKELAAFRDGDGRWKAFPFYYTLLALSEIDEPVARRELQYAAPVCERLAGRINSPDPVLARRRHALLERVLARC